MGRLFDLPVHRLQSVHVRCAQEAGVPSITIDGDHSPFYSNVERLAEILEGGDS